MGTHLGLIMQTNGSVVDDGNADGFRRSRGLGDDYTNIRQF